MRCLLLLALLAGPAFAGGDDELPPNWPRPAPPLRLPVAPSPTEREAWLRASRRETIAGKVLLPSGVLLGLTGAAMMLAASFGVVRDGNSLLFTGLAMCPLGVISVGSGATLLILGSAHRRLAESPPR